MSAASVVLRVMFGFDTLLQPLAHWDSPQLWPASVESVEQPAPALHDYLVGGLSGMPPVSQASAASPPAVVAAAGVRHGRTDSAFPGAPTVPQSRAWFFVHAAPETARHR